MRWHMRTASDIITILSPIITVVENHVTSKTQIPLPYVVLLEMDSVNMFADNQTYQEIIPIDLILHQASRNHTLEASIKQALNDNHIPYEVSSPTWDKNYQLYATTFSINL